MSHICSVADVIYNHVLLIFEKLTLIKNKERQRKKRFSWLFSYQIDFIKNRKRKQKWINLSRSIKCQYCPTI